MNDSKQLQFGIMPAVEDVLAEITPWDEHHAVVGSILVEPSKLRQRFGDDDLSDALDAHPNLVRKEQVWLLQWTETAEMAEVTSYYLLKQNRMLDMEDAIVVLPPRRIREIGYELDEMFEPRPGDEPLNAVRMLHFTRHDLSPDEEMPLELRDFLRSRMDSARADNLTVLQWTC